MKKNSAKVLIVSTIPRFTLSLARTAALAGFQPIVLTDKRWGLDCLSRYVSHRVVIDQAAFRSDFGGAIAQINQLIATHQIDIVIPADTICTRMLSQCSEQIQGASLFPLSSPKLIEQMYDKWDFAKLLEAHSFPMPKTRLIETLDQVEALDLEFPVIVKPPQGESGIGIHRIDDRENLIQAVQQCDTQKSLPLLVQEWLPGYDIDLSLLANHGELVAWTVQQKEGDNLRFVDYPQMVEIGRKLCQASSYHGVAHIDMRVDQRTGEVKVIECNPRFWGSLMYSTWMGVNFLALGIQLTQPVDEAEFQPVEGLCKHPWLTRSELTHWIKRGFQAPTDWHGKRKNIWWHQILDPAPEWFDWFSTQRTSKS